MSFTRDDLIRLMRDARDQGASEVHFKVPNRVLFRIQGSLLPHGNTPLTPQLAMQAAQSLCGLANLELPLNTVVEREFAFGLSGIGRFTVQIYRQRGTVALLIHRHELQIPTLDQLGFPADVERVIASPGLVLCAGLRSRPAMIASLVDRFNAEQRGLATILEERISYLHRDAMAAIAQRSVGVDIESMPAGLRAALRHLPDLLAIGEVSEVESAQLTLSAADHGIRVLVGVTARSPNDAIHSFLRNFPVADRVDAEQRLRQHLRGILVKPDEGPAQFERFAR